jgi:SAM-dependent methyltransferase
MKSPYNSEFYHSYIGESEASAATVVPKIVELFKPCSVIDIGCGVGTWLKVFKEHGVQRLRGLDGSYVKEVDYRIDWSCFREANLENPSRPENESFDLAICLEVAEHITPDKADTFVNFLSGCADVIVFSAAIPNQGGTDHRNEQWQSFWASKFIQRGFYATNLIRSQIWGSDQCAYYYQQNMILYVKKDSPWIAKHSGAQWQSDPDNCQVLDVVHPAKWLQAHDDRQLGLKRIRRALPNAIKMAVERRIGLRKNVAD